MRLSSHTSYILYTYYAETSSAEGVPLEVDMSASPLHRECQHFIKCCLNREEPISNGREGRDVVRILGSLQLSMDRNEEVKVKVQLSSLDPPPRYCDI